MKGTMYLKLFDQLLSGLVEPDVRLLQRKLQLVRLKHLQHHCIHEFF